jgi:hypothetical protein
MESVPSDAAGHRRSPATMPGYHRGRPPHNKGEHYPADPPTIDVIVIHDTTQHRHAAGRTRTADVDDITNNPTYRVSTAPQEHARRRQLHAKSNPT